MKHKNNNNFLLFVPKHSDKIEWKESNGTVSLVFHHDKIIERIIRIFIKRPKISTIDLDKIGSAVWLLIDGKKNVYEIGKNLKGEFGEKVEPLYDRLNMYLSYLNKRRWIFWEK